MRNNPINHPHGAGGHSRCAVHSRRFDERSITQTVFDPGAFASVNGVVTLPSVLMYTTLPTDPLAMSTHVAIPPPLTLPLHLIRTVSRADDACKN